MKTYTRTIDGIPHTFQYSDADAKALIEQGVDLVEVKAAPKPANKARSARNKA